MKQFERNILLFGEKNQQKLLNSCVCLFGVGGVGSYTFEALARVGIGKIIIFDYDKVDITNINRQIIATHKTIDQYKVDVAKQRGLEINPNIEIETYNIKVDNEFIDSFDFNNVDYIVDAIDDVNAKIAIIQKAISLNIPVISSMGTGNKLDPTKLILTDISKTSNCPLSRVMRKKLRDLGINHLQVLFSSEIPNKDYNSTNKIASVSFVPSTGGLLIASKVVNDIIKRD